MKKRNFLLQNLEYYLAKGIAEFIRAIPLKTAFSLAKIFGKIAYYADFYDRKLMIQHIMHAGIAANKKEAAIIAKENYIHMLKLGIEFLRFDQYFTSDESFRERINILPMSSEIEDTIKNAKSIIFIGAHLGNWEMTGLFCSALWRPLLSVMSPISNEKITNFILTKREKFKQEICLKKNSFKLLLNALNNRRSVGIISDEHAGRRGVETTFFGHPAMSHISPALLHIRTNSPILFGVATRTSDSFTYNLSMSGPFKLEKSTGNFEEDVKILAQMYTTAIENEVRKTPEQWIWCHKRWLDINREGKKKKRKRKKSMNINVSD